jgi:type II restriction/modification system DNA methylase subunit YeeA
MPLEEAALYEGPFEYAKKVVFEERKNRAEKRQREYWWLHARPSPRYREILKRQNRYIVSPALAKYRVFIWLTNDVLADHATVVFARDDDYFFGVLHSRIHEVWALRMGTSLEDRPRYTPSTTFETFPFPWPPGQEPAGAPRVEAIAEAARALVAQRDAWLNPAGASEAELKKRTLTNLYNARPTWLDLAHRKLDAAVLDAYGWPYDLSGEGILERLLALNLERAATDRNE